MSPAKDLGSRHVCWKCGSKFYDLNKPNPSCPKCGADPREDPALKTPPPKAVKAAAAPKRASSSSDEYELDDEHVDDADEGDDVDDEPIDEHAEDDDLY
ncbi:MAG TPA: FYDLN acid domain-containing protein [Vulgatibacter sp.]|nr:FYDLN acid domain-containing protein [Vulgatibacter sp.]